MRNLYSFCNSRPLYGLLFLILSIGVGGQTQPWLYDFGTATGTYTGNGSTTFLLQPPNGEDYVFAPNGGEIRLQNENIGFGNGSYLRMKGSNRDIEDRFTKFSVRDYLPADLTFMLKFDVRFGTQSGDSGVSDGRFSLLIGKGGTFYNSNNTFIDNQYFTAIQWRMGTGGSISTHRRVGTTWVEIPGNPFVQGTNYQIEIYGNNTNQTEEYYKDGIIYTINSNTYDLWVNGVLILDNGAKGGIGTGTIDSFMFLGNILGNNTINNSHVFLDNFIYATELPNVHPSPWEESYEDDMFTSIWWSDGFGSIGSFSSWFFTNSNAYIPNSTSYYLTKNFWSGSSNGYFIIPNVGSVQEGDKLSFTYALKNYSNNNAPPSGSGNFTVAIAEDLTPIYTTISTVNNNGVGGWQDYEYDLSGYVGKVIRVRVIVTRTSGDYWIGFDNFAIGPEKACPYLTKYRSTGVWSNGNAANVADENKRVIIEGDLTLTNNQNRYACRLEVLPSGRLTMNAGSSFTVNSGIQNKATPDRFIVSSDASLLQKSPLSVNVGEITVKRDATVPYNQYNFWSSPVKNQNMYSIYDVPANQVMTYNTSTDYYNVIAAPATSEFGKGFSIKGPAGNIENYNVTSNFIGVIQNEAQNIGQNIIPISGVNNGFNLIGNPFPSNFDLKLLYDDLDNNTLFANADFFFWDNTGNTVLTQQGSGYNSYVNHNYAIYNAASNTGVKAPGGGPKIPNGIVKPGQGFIMKANSDGGLVVKNNMRTNAIRRSTGAPEAPYFKNGNSEDSVSNYTSARPRENKFWIELVNPDDIRIQMAVGYFDEADDRFERFDTKILSEAVSENIYSYSEDAQKLIINGLKAPFSKRNVIPLGVKLFKSGVYKIHLSNAMGIFSNQMIYVKDKWLNQTHNLYESDYEFETVNGIFENRFEIVFIPYNPMADVAIATQLKIQKVNQHIEITSDNMKLVEVEIFNLTGLSEFKRSQINAYELQVPLAGLSKQILFVKVQTESGEVVTKKVINH